MGINKSAPWQCDDCHTASGTEYGKYNNTGNPYDTFLVSEHYIGSSDIKANSKPSGGDATVLSCLGCHNKTEMLIPANDPDFGTFADSDGDGVVGGNSSFYHYGKNRSSELRTQHNSSDCGAGSTTCDLSDMAADTNYTYTDCTYCHQNATTAFSSAMNYSGQGENSHENMTDHTDNSGGPACLDCHYNASQSAQGRIHDSGLFKPEKDYATGGAGMYDSANVCEQCHTDKEVHSSAPPNADTLECADCHANASVYTSGYSNKQIHGIRYVTQTGAYSAPWTKTNVADCTTCHMGSSLTSVNNTNIPKVPTPTGEFNHSENASAGNIWNTSTPGYLGPWKPAANNLNACWYCHGNVTEVQHNITGLGRIDKAYDDNDQIINGSISTSSIRS
jgi:hypothetical protein